MARRNKKNNEKILSVFKWMIGGLFILFAVIFAGQKSLAFLRTSPLFQIKGIVIDPSLKFIQSRHLDRLTGQNIFRVNLRHVQQQLQAQYSEIDQIKLSREFPNRIFVAARRRSPFAVLTVGRKDYVIDDQGVVLTNAGIEKGALPCIYGIDADFKVVSGQPVHLREIEIASQFIKYFSANKYLENFRVESMDMSNLSKIYCYLSGDIKIIIDRYKIEQKVQKLALLLSAEQIQTSEVGYIDLRFKEPVIGKDKKR